MEREKFSSRLGFILISAGCAIGLGNVYRFPIWCGAYGGGLFLLFYLIFLLLLGLPVMTVELAVGRGSRRSIANSFDVLEKKGQKWHLMKYLGVAGNYLLMMFYTSISGWFLMYFWKYLTGSIMEMNTAEQLGNVFVSMVSNPGLNIALTFLVVLLCFGVWAFFHTKTGTAMTAVGSNPVFAKAAGIHVDKMRLLSVVMSTWLGAIGILVYQQGFGFIQLYNAPFYMALPSVAALLIGGASANKASIFNVVLGTFVFQGLTTMTPTVINSIIHADISEIVRIIVTQGMILYALTRKSGGSK